MHIAGKTLEAVRRMAYSRDVDYKTLMEVLEEMDKYAETHMVPASFAQVRGAIALQAGRKSASEFVFEDDGLEPPTEEMFMDVPEAEDSIPDWVDNMEEFMEPPEGEG